MNDTLSKLILVSFCSAENHSKLHVDKRMYHLFGLLCLPRPVVGETYHMYI